MYKHILLPLLFIGLLVVSSQAQDPAFSQFYAAPLQLNPAFAGSTYAPRISLNYRNQWPSFNNAYVTYAASFDQYIESIHSGLGLMVQADDAGDGIYKTNSFSGFYGYRLQVKEDFFLKFGIEAGMTQTTVDWDKLLFYDQIDRIDGPIYPTEESRPDNLSNIYLDIGAGVLAYSQYFYGGVSIKHLNTPDNSLLEGSDNLKEGLPMRLTVHGGTEIQLREGNNRKSASFISPNIMLIKQGDFGQINAGAYINTGSFFAGAWYRYAWSNSDAAIALVGVQYDIFKIGYSYDFTISGLAQPGTGGAHEISLIINFENSQDFQSRRKASRYNDCMNIFR